MKAIRIVSGFLFAPLATVIVEFMRADIGPGLGRLGILLIYAYMFGLTLGIPTFVALWKLKWLHLWQVMAFSLVLGLVVAILMHPNHITLASPHLANELGFYVAHSAAVGFTFWLIAMCRYGSNQSLNPD